MTLYELFQVLLLLTMVIWAVSILLTGFIWLLLKTIHIVIRVLEPAWSDIRRALRIHK